MPIAIMQPYLFPYLGYFQLLASSDIFIAYDDAQYMKNGWVNRNQLLIHGSPYLFTLSVNRAPLKTLICNSSYSAKMRSELTSLERTLVQNYSRAPFFKQVMELFVSLFSEPEYNVATMNIKGILQIRDYLKIDCQVVRSSELQYNRVGSATDKVISMCREVNATHYINPIGGQQLYDPEYFQNQGIKLSFLKSEPSPYQQGRAPFVPNLSILDVLMFNSPQEIQEKLKQYVLLS